MTTEITADELAALAARSDLDQPHRKALPAAEQFERELAKAESVADRITAVNRFRGILLRLQDAFRGGLGIVVQWPEMRVATEREFDFALAEVRAGFRALMRQREGLEPRVKQS